MVSTIFLDGVHLEVVSVLLDVRPEPVPLVTDQDGVVRVGTSRVTLDAVIASFTAGATAEEIAQRYPSVALDDVYAVVTFYLRNRDRVEEYLRSRQAEAQHVRASNEARHPPDGLRERLLARSRT